MARFVELTRISGGYVVVNIDEILSIVETHTRKMVVKDSSFQGPYSIINFKQLHRRVLVREQIPEINKKFINRPEKNLW